MLAPSPEVRRLRCGPWSRVKAFSPPRQTPGRATKNLGCEGPGPSPGALSHLGIQVSSTEAVRAATDRLRAAGLAHEEEHGTDCCYALQDKVSVKDPKREQVGGLRREGRGHPASSHCERHE